MLILIYRDGNDVASLTPEGAVVVFLLELIGLTSVLSQVV